MAVTVYYYNVTQKNRYDISSIVTNIEYNGSVERYYRTCALQVVERSNVPFNTGGRIRVYENKRLLFDGKVWVYTNSAKGGISLICHDNAYYLHQNVVNLIRGIDSDGTTLTTLFKYYAKLAGLQTGFVKNTTHKHKNVNYIGETMQTVLQGLIGRERRGSGKKYYVQANGPKIEFRERGALQGIVIDTDMATDITATLDAQGIYTKFRVVGTAESKMTSEKIDAAGTTAIHSSNYKGPDATDYQSGFRARLRACDKWDPLIMKVANGKKVDPLLLKILVMMESSGNPDVSSSDGLGSIGLTQITPGNVGVYVHAARLKDPQYNLESACYIMKAEKYKIAKNQGRVASVTNMAHYWNGWPSSHGNTDGPYGATFRTIYAGFGGDPDKLFGDVAVSAAPSSETDSGNADKTKETFDVYSQNTALVNKFGSMTNIVQVRANSSQEAKEAAGRLARSMREERTVVVECMGHHAGLAGRKVHFRDNDITEGTWYIKADSHTIDQYGHKMTLTLDKYDTTPEPEVPEAPEEAKDAIEATPAPSKNFIRPADGRLTQGYGPASGAYGYTFHNGIDIANVVGTPIRAAASGKVITVRTGGAYGTWIQMEHQVNGEKFITTYAHLSAVLVRLGESVSQGKIIAKMGSTGNSTGSHLHFEIHKGTYVYSSHNAANSVSPTSYF